MPQAQSRHTQGALCLSPNPCQCPPPAGFQARNHRRHPASAPQWHGCPQGSLHTRHRPSAAPRVGMPRSPPAPGGIPLIGWSCPGTQSLSSPAPG
uniref:Uncharacterized protein n=1 Tax=Arundo donax TaxID=35708 RepID=A0A0A9EK55_ARUDO